jgi:hypothetical protein
MAFLLKQFKDFQVLQSYSPLFYTLSYKESNVYILTNSTYCCALSFDLYFVGKHEQGLLFKNLTNVLIEIISMS